MNAEAIVIGGGIFGASTAYHLSKKLPGGVLLLERNRIAHGSTAKAATLLSLARNKAAVIPWVRCTYELIEDLSNGDPSALGFARVGALHTARNAAGITAIDEVAAVSRDNGVAPVGIDPEETERSLPWLARGVVRKAWKYEEEAFVDAYQLTARLLEHARANGCVVREGMSARRILLDSRGVYGVETKDNVIRTRRVVLATGIFGNILLAEYGLALPMAPVRSQYWIADEPTSALDVTSQGQVLQVLRECRERRNTAMLFVSHDLDIVSSLAHDVLVLHNGIREEYGATDSVFSAPSAEYTKFLLNHRLSAELPQESSGSATPESADKWTDTPSTVLRMENAGIGYGGGLFTAPRIVLRNINIELHQGKCLGIVGESGSGKSSLVKAVTGMAKLLDGSIELFGKPMREMRPAEKRSTGKRCQLISQNTHSALNPRLPVKTILSEPLQVHGQPCPPARIRAMLEEVGLREEHAAAHPHQLSGGQRQRINIARALALDPEIVLCDEIVSALDVSVQHQILHLLKGIQKKRGMSLVFISHDLRVIRYMADDILLVESGGASICVSASNQFQFSDAV